MELVKISAPFNGVSNYKEAFLAHPYQANLPVRPETQVFSSTAKFSGLSTQQDDFVSKGFCRREAFVPVEAARAHARGDYTTTYGAAMQVWGTGRADQFVPANKREILAPFAGVTEAQENYTAKELNKTASFKPANLVTTSGTFSGDTQYRTAFVMHAPSCVVPRSYNPAEYILCRGPGCTHAHAHAEPYQARYSPGVRVRS